MLYDILIIDDDFSENFKSQELALWDEKKPYPDAYELLLDFIKNNLRVTYTTGEIDDLNRLLAKDLSAIQYIFCDLYLEAQDPFGTDYKTINSKIVGILEKVNSLLKQEKIILYINSKNIEK